MDLGGAVAMLFGGANGERRTSGELATKIAQGERELEAANREVRIAQDRLDGLLTDKDVGMPTTDREVDRARRALDEWNSKARAWRGLLDRARRDKGVALKREAQEAHAAHVARLRAAVEAHKAALAAFTAWAAASPVAAVRTTIAALVAEVPAAALDNSALGGIQTGLMQRLEQEAFFRSDGAFPSARAVMPRMPAAFFSDYQSMVDTFEREAAEVIRHVEGAAPGALVPQAA